ncbi:MAG TPA: GTP cyclohydrolase I FolE [Puia sp.]|nr:GTP cyclohydrolase I FolE [Puia sp.]
MNLPESKSFPNGHSIIRQLAGEQPFSKNGTGLSKEEKIDSIAGHFREIMIVLGLDPDAGSLKDTPARVARMYINETFSGLDKVNEPEITLFENNYHYTEMLVEKNISVYSTCEHHFVPIIGKAHIGYIPNGRVVGLSKLNRIVHYFSRRPQVQERLTTDIAAYLKKALHTEDVAVVIEATHLCIAARGIRDVDSSTITASFNGQFLNTAKRREFNDRINHK